ncbi:hypothetical protein K469DRAFT_200431 [Zopfia rhizophila CBS 207.26]|uniref:C2H2-type domain-containing protein n=1 Tax=Zopfia rhizophila CBS 207.26 TaxID=1314779 RepID=A0A6A6E1Z7_9PEZI|nr:hypothetical protein K469DRAFT_200431 [Zopfia rhizophila CBS 207.26]
MTLADAPPSLDQASASPSEEPPHDRDEPETRQLSHVDPLFASDIHSGHDFSDRDDKRKNGRPVELVREVDDGARSSMARRRKSDKPDMMHVCRNCKKEFKRPCDLIKHEKTHSRPWKCTEEKCKYYGLGWPTEKERDRHVNDKHSSAPPQYKCLYSPCTYSSKRESNCKQHMEKAHGWEYVRSKSNGRSSKPSSATYTFSSASPSTTITPFGNFDFAHVPLSSPALSFDLDEAFAAGGFSIFDSEDIFLKNNHLETAMAASLESSGPISDALVIDPVLAPPEDVEATMSAFTSIADKSGGAAPTIMAQEMSCGVVPCISEHIGFSTASEKKRNQRDQSVLMTNKLLKRTRRPKRSRNHHQNVTSDV